MLLSQLLKFSDSHTSFQPLKTPLRILCFLIFTCNLSQAQITYPIIKANFGVEADLRSNFFNGLVQSGNDDWFLFPGTPGAGQFVIDTTGAANLLANYASNPDSRKLPFYKNMRFPPYTVVNNRLLVDAYFVRDYHGDDSTIFASGSNKNGMSPGNWSCPVSQSIPDKNEILDVMIHVRKAGPNITDSMWLFGGISIENTTGNRYFDFELYQTDIFYDRATRKFNNYGPDAGHTRWQFDAAGNMLAPGDIILTAEYSSSALTMVEARIWIDRADLLINPVGFNWSGSFDGASSGSQYGYAGIQPETAGAFNTGLQSSNNTWAGPFSLILGDNSQLTNYAARQFMEFSVNMTKLGLDNAKIFGGDDCLMPFRRVIVKTRASTSFTAELKDFVAPFDFFIAPAAQIETATPMICDTGSLSNIYVTNPIPTSIYQWTTPNGRFVGPATGPSVFVDTPGVYIVTQYLQISCGAYATDTITVGRLPDCNVLANNLINFKGSYTNPAVRLEWKVLNNALARAFYIERSTDGTTFTTIGMESPRPGWEGEAIYNTTDDLSGLNTPFVYYRIRMIESGNVQLLSSVIKFGNSRTDNNPIRVLSNPVKDQLQLMIRAEHAAPGTLSLFDQSGKRVFTTTISLQKGISSFQFNCMTGLPEGLYQIVLATGNRISSARILHKN